MMYAMLFVLLASFHSGEGARARQRCSVVEKCALQHYSKFAAQLPVKFNTPADGNQGRTAADAYFACGEDIAGVPIHDLGVYIDEVTCAIVICFDDVKRKQPYHLNASAVRKAEKLTFDGLTTNSGEPIPITAAAFEVYIVQPADTSHIHNDGAGFNQELRAIFKTLAPGDWVIFDNVRVLTPDGTIRTIQAPAFKVD